MINKIYLSSRFGCYLCVLKRIRFTQTLLLTGAFSGSVEPSVSLRKFQRKTDIAVEIKAPAESHLRAAKL